MSETQQLEQILRGCLDHKTVNAATNSLLTISKSPTFLDSLLGYIYSGISDEPVLILAVTTYKNFLKEYYNHRTTPLPEDKRRLARDTCQQLYFKISHSNVAVNVYKEIVYILVAVSYPWEGLDLTKIEEAEPNSYIFEQIGVFYEYVVDDKERDVLEFTLNQYLPMIEGYIKQILENYSEQTAKVLSSYLNMMLSSSNMELPQYLRDFNHIQLWLLYLKTILTYQVNLNTPDHQNYYLQNQILAAKIIRHFINQHCKDNSEEDDLPWVHQFIAQFVPDTFATVVTLLFEKKYELHGDVLSNIIRTVYSGYKNKFIRPFIMNIASKVLFEEMLPLIDYSEADLNIFQEDALEFIRRQEDITVNPARWEAIEVVKTLIYLDFEGKSFLMRFIEYSAGVLKDPASSVTRKATVLHLIPQFKTEVLGNKLLKEQFGQLVSEYFFPYLSDPNPILVYTACRLFSVYLIEVNLQKNIVQSLISKLFDCLNAESLGVKFMSVLAFTSLLEDDSDAVQFVQPHFSIILTNYLSLIQQMDHQGLLKALQKMIKFFDKQILSVGPKLIKHLIQMFYKYADREEKDEDDEEPGFLDNPVTAALGTIRQLLDVELDSNTYFEISKDIIEILVFVVKKKMKYCFDDVYDIFAVLMNRGEQIVDFVFPYLYFRTVLDGVFYGNSLQGIECEYLDVVGMAQKSDPAEQETILSILKNLIVKMPRGLLFAYPLPNAPALILCLIQNKILQPSQLQTLDYSQISGNWLAIIKSYAAVIYSINSVEMDLSLIKSFSSSISFYPWIANINDLDIFVSIIRKVMLRFQDQDEDEVEQLSTLQLMEKYANEQSEGESDFEDGGYVDEECSYSYRYNSPFQLKNDLIMIREKLALLSGENSQQIAKSLGKNQYPKLLKLIADVDQAKI